LDEYSEKNVEWEVDNADYQSPDLITMHLALKDVWLDYFLNRQVQVSQLFSGEQLILRESECVNTKGQSILKFSQKFLKEIEDQKAKGFVPKSAKVNFVLFWKKEETVQEYQVVLPEIQFQKVKQDLGQTE
jgi:ATP-dependent DNA helicase RecQ